MRGISSANLTVGESSETQISQRLQRARCCVVPAKQTTTVLQFDILPKGSAITGHRIPSVRVATPTTAAVDDKKSGETIAATTARRVATKLRGERLATIFGGASETRRALRARPRSRPSTTTTTTATIAQIQKREPATATGPAKRIRAITSAAGDEHTTYQEKLAPAPSDMQSR